MNIEIAALGIVLMFIAGLINFVKNNYKIAVIVMHKDLDYMFSKNVKSLKSDKDRKEIDMDR